MVSIIGGCYREINLEDNTTKIFGSGLRCSKFFLESKEDIKFFTSGNFETIKHLDEYKKVYDGFEYKCVTFSNMLTFKYSFALDNPLIYPNPLKINRTEKIEVECDNIICFGMLESDFSINAQKAIYDPQTSVKPKRFSEFGKADSLVYIVNFSESKALAKSDEIKEIKEFFFNTEKAYALIIKNGPFGATLYYNNKEIRVPSYITSNVNKIGSGDIFTSSFSYYWIIKNNSIEDSILKASKTTALFCDREIMTDIDLFNEFEYKEYNIKELQDKKIYLASPFFSLSEIILVDKVRNSFIDFGVNLFSPFHDVGYGKEESIAKKDLEAIEESDIIFCLLDGLDSGILVEAGVSMAKNKKIVGYHTTCNEDSLLMLKPAKLKLYKNLTTAIYQTIWNL